MIILPLGFPEGKPQVRQPTVLRLTNGDRLKLKKYPSPVGAFG